MMIKNTLVFLISMIGSFLGIVYFKDSSLLSFWCGVITTIIGFIIINVNGKINNG